MLFKKKKRYSDYIIDLGKLKSKGIINDADASTASQNTETTSEGIGFLGNLASSAETSSFSSDNINLSSGYDERDLPLSLRDKIRSMSEKLYKVLDRIDLLEHKIDRIERRLNINDI